MEERRMGLDLDLALFDGDAGGETGQQGETQATSAATRQGEGEARPIAAPSGLEPPARQKQANGQWGPRQGRSPCWGEDEQRSDRDLAVGRGEGCGACEDDVSGILPRAAKEPAECAANGSVTAPETPKERLARYRALVGGEFKDLFTADTQRIINQRFKETRGMEERLAAQRPILERLMGRYGLSGEDLAALSAAMDAEEAKTREETESREAETRRRQEAETRQRQVLERHREGFARDRLDRWAREMEEAVAAYPDFDLAEGMGQSVFRGVLRGGGSMKQAYEALHLEDIKASAARQAALEREREITEHIRARGIRPQENAAAAQNALRAKVDLERMTKEERAEVARRAMRGETITFG